MVLVDEFEAAQEGFEDGDGDVFADWTVEEESGGAAVFGDEGDAAGDGFGSCFGFERLVFEEDGALVDRGDAENGAGDFGASGSDEAGEAEDFSAPDGERDVLESRAGKVDDFESSFGLRFSVVGKRSVEVAADHEPDDFCGRCLGGLEVGDFLSVAKDSDFVGDFEDLVHVVGDDADCASLTGEGTDDGEKVGGFVGGEGGGRFVEDQIFGIEGEGGGEFEELLVGDGEPLGFAGGVECESELLEDVLRLFSGGFPVDESKVPGEVAAEDIFGDGEFVEGEGFLVDEADATFLGVFGRGEFERFVAQDDMPGILSVDAGEDFGERGFSSAVFTGDGVDFSGLEGEFDVLEDLKSGKGEVDSFAGEGVHGIVG